MPLIDIEDSGTGSFSVIPAKLSDKEFIQLAPRRHREWGLPVVYRSTSGKVTERHDPYQDTVNTLLFPFRIGFVISVAAALFIVALCCIPGLAHLIFAA